MREHETTELLVFDEDDLRGVMCAVVAMTEVALSGHSVPSTPVSELDRLVMQANAVRQIALIASGRPYGDEDASRRYRVDELVDLADLADRILSRLPDGA